jgi:two-component system CheB/CheR fusion protein
VIDDFEPDAAILDIAMPGMSGYEVAERVRAAPRGAAMLLLAATGWGSEADRQASSLAGFDAHLVKPIDIDELRRLIETSPSRGG